MNQHVQPQATGTAVATQQPRTAVEAVCQTLVRPEMKDRIAAALPPGVDPDRFIRVTLTAIQQNPAIANVERQSLYNSALRAAADGLLPDGREGAFVEFSVKEKDTDGRETWVKKAQWMPMVGGIIKRLAGAGINIDAQVVYENDEFEQTLGDDAAIHHKAPKLGQPRGKHLGVYAIARLPNGMVMREVMDTDQVEQVRQASKAKDSGPWKQWWTEMARKTVIRRLAKRLPILDPKIAETVQRDDDLYDFASGNASQADSPAPDTAQNTTSATAGPRRPRGLDKVAAAAGAAPAASGGAVIEGTAERIDPETGEVQAGAEGGAIGNTDEAASEPAQGPDF